MSRSLLVLGSLAFAISLPACGLTLDYAPPEDGGMDGGAPDASRADAEAEDAATDAPLPDADTADAPPTDAARLVCGSNADCLGGSCVHACDGAGEGYCVAPEACPPDQVCGCDGMIYASACDAHRAGVEVGADTACPGVCVLGDHTSCASGTCVTCPGELPTCAPDTLPPCLLETVCGCDGNTYGGNCQALAGGARASTRGPCPGDCAASADCGAGHFCARSECGAPFGTCQALPTVRMPLVCGCSGRRYLNDRRALINEGLLAECDACTTPATGCCADSADCLPTEACVASDSSAGLCAPSGTCEDLALLLLDGQCWSDADCDPGLTCESAQVCPCGASCLRPDAPGRCTGP